jgi:hypothetical protein
MDQLKTMQPVFEVTPRYDEMKSLIAEGIYSANDISTTEEDVFVGKFNPVLGAERTREIYQRAQKVVFEPKNEGLSEYERFMSGIALVLGSVALADLTADDIVFLSDTHDMDAERIFELALATRLAQSTVLPSEVFYGFFRQGLPTGLKELLVTDPTTQRSALESSLKAGIIPAHFEYDLEYILSRLQEIRAQDSDEKKDN